MRLVPVAKAAPGEVRAKRRACLALAVACSALWLVGRDVAEATTVVPLRARDLVAGSVAAVRGRVQAIGAALDPTSGTLHTYVTIDPLEVVFGHLPPGPLVLRELGGRAGGHELWIFGSAEYRVGESVFVFVSRAADGSLHTTGLGLGKYGIVERADGAHAVRALSHDVTVLDARSGGPDEALRTDDQRLGDLLATVRRLAADSSRVAAAVSPPHVALEPRTAFVLLNPFSRWFEPDDGRSIGYFVDATGDATLGPAVSRAAADAAFAAWTAVAASPLTLEDAGDAQPAPFAGCPDDNRIVFNDPFGELDDPLNCRGVLAIGGFCNSGETRTINGSQFRRIITGKVTFNDGWGACPIWTACNLAEIATHEVGHTVGLGHSTDDTATMRREAHFDGRCAALAADDEQAIDFVYPVPPPPTDTPTVTATLAPSATPTRTGTNTRTPSRSATPTRTASPTRTLTATRTASPTRTTTFSPTGTASVTPLATSSATASATASPSPSASSTPSATRSATATITPTATATPPPTPGSWLDLLVDALRRALETLRSARLGL